MNEKKQDAADPQAIDVGRRRILGAAGAGALASTLGGVFGGTAGNARAQSVETLRWGIVGTGMIANRLAPMIKLADTATLAAVSSRRMATAREFASEHGVPHSFDSWELMLASDQVDAIYVATPTSVREDICVAAANHGKHVLGEKPFASLPSLQRITAACRSNGVGFMDGTHFVHHPRTALIRKNMMEQAGWPWSVASAFQFNLTDRSNIRYNPALEPMGAIGDAGWYNMRAAVEYIADSANLQSATAYLRRDTETDAVISGSGVIQFDDGSTSTWNCGFDSGAGNMDLRISGARGTIKLDDFVSGGGDKAASYIHSGTGSSRRSAPDRIDVPSPKPAAALMFEDFAGMVGDADLIEASVRASERTQAWLDASWRDAVARERG
jgi:predicted dehydrogenase